MDSRRRHVLDAPRSSGARLSGSLLWMSEDLASLAPIAADVPGLRLLLLFGSRAQGRSHEGSDWDFGYLGDRELEPEALHRAVIVHLRTERVDLVNLVSASGLLRYRAAAQGRVIYGQPGEHQRFWLEAVGFWCDVEPVLRRGYERVLERLGA